MWRVRFENGAEPNSRLRYALSQPGWVTKWALAAAAVVVVVPLAMLALAGLVVGLVVFVTIGLLARVVAIVRTAFGGLWPNSSRRDGRDNVRVIDRD